MRLLSWSVSLTSCISSSASFPPAPAFSCTCSSTGATSTSTCSNSNWMLLQRTFRHHHTDSQRVVHVLYNNAHSSPEKASSKSLPALSIRPKQTRRKPKARRPNGYWSDRDNLRKEIEMFWHDVGVTTTSPPTLSPIPNEALLNHFGRNDLRWAIARHGGREAVSEWMGGVPLVPGKWAEAVATCSEVQQLLDPSNVAGRKLSADVPPKSPQAEHRDIISSSTKPRWKHRPGRKPKGYWTEERVLVEFLKYLYDCKLKMNRPSVWMPRPSELPHDLKGAVARFGGRKKICEQLQLVPFNEWNYFERQFQLILELQKYLETKSGRGSPAEHCFPHMSDVLDHDEYKTLYDLVQYFGGRKFVASRLGLELCGDANSSRRAWQTSYQSTDLTLISFGRFNLDFAVRLLGFIRNDLMEKRPPLKPATIQMPRKELLLARGETRLAEEIEIYGGYENVARRLGLDF
mmetsp:Transcript_36530/g.79901  ORF Transcript_36530/g.79901 Transcript_36530/m.79901 type:complete len:461 (-) Transcript_36530:556-1938(-)